MAKRKDKTPVEQSSQTVEEDFMSVYINPLTDFGFKRIFLNKELLIAFLNDVVNTDIKDITYLPTERLQN